MTAYVLAVLTLLPLAVLVWWVFAGPLARYRERRLYGDHNPPAALPVSPSGYRTPEERVVDRLVADYSVPLLDVVQAAELVAIRESRSKPDDKRWPLPYHGVGPLVIPRPGPTALRADRITAGTITIADDWLEAGAIRVRASSSAFDQFRS